MEVLERLFFCDRSRSHRFRMNIFRVNNRLHSPPSCQPVNRKILMLHLNLI